MLFSAYLVYDQCLAILSDTPRLNFCIEIFSHICLLWQPTHSGNLILYREARMLSNMAVNCDLGDSVLEACPHAIKNKSPAL